MFSCGSDLFLDLILKNFYRSIFENLQFHAVQTHQTKIPHDKFSKSIWFALVFPNKN